MKTIKIIILVCLFTLLFVENSFSAKVIEESPVNIISWGFGYDYRENTSYLYNPTGQAMFMGAEGTSGGSFNLVALINPGLGTCLTDHSQIIEVRAQWLGAPGGEPAYEFSLIPNTCRNEIVGQPAYTAAQAWPLAVRPAPWMFTGTWKIILTYNCSGKVYEQTREVSPNPRDTIPPVPTGVLVEKSSDGLFFYVSWNGMGNPGDHPWFEYRIQVYDENGICPEATFTSRFPTGWSYNNGPNRVNINIPIGYGGRLIRIEQRNGAGMSPPPAGTLGGAPNRAILTTKLPLN